MDVTADRVERVQTQGMHVSREVLGQFWAEVERTASVEDDRLLGMMLTCRWLAGSAATRGEPVSRSPFRRRLVPPEPEEIEAEFVAAVAYLARKHGDDGGAAQRADGIVKALEWLWRGSRSFPPVEIPGYVPDHDQVEADLYRQGS